jgi:hypothetical protein
MNRNFKRTISFLILFILPATIYAQKNVTQFLGIPIDGYKAEMIQKLKAKGFTSNKYKDDVLEGEFNGNNVQLFIGTNNNKVWRIGVMDKNSTDETNIKFIFNNLINQFRNNNKYRNTADSTISKYTIPQEDDISYGISVEKKRYEALFYQKSIKYESLSKEYEMLKLKATKTEKEFDRVLELITELAIEEISMIQNNPVWFFINQDDSEYRIMLFYENGYNKANGDVL